MAEATHLSCEASHNPPRALWSHIQCSSPFKMEHFTEVFVWGANKRGQLGLGQAHKGKRQLTPVPCAYNIRVKQLSCGEDFTVLLAFNGLAYAMGSNKDGRLGIGDHTVSAVTSPCLVVGITGKLALVACGAAHSLALGTDAKVFSWGSGESGALGTGSVCSLWKPGRVSIPQTMTVLVLSAGGRHSAFIIQETLHSGNLLMCGAGESGQLGTGRRDRELAPVAISMHNIKQVACGLYHTLLLNTRGELLGTGGNTHGQLGTGNHKGRKTPVTLGFLEGVFIEQVAAGGHSACISDKGELYIWGTCALGDFTSPFKTKVGQVRELCVGGSFGLAVDTHGDVHIWGRNSKGELAQGDIKKSSRITTVAALSGQVISRIACGSNFCISVGGGLKASVPPKGRRSHSRRDSSRKGTPDKQRPQEPAAPQAKTHSYEELLALYRDLQGENTRLNTVIGNNLAAFEREKQLIYSNYEMTLREDSHWRQSSASGRIGQLTTENRQLEDSCQQLARENSQLQGEALELDRKNRGLLQDLENCLNQERRTRTLQLLRSRNSKSSSPRKPPQSTESSRCTPCRASIQARILELRQKHSHNQAIISSM